LNFGVDDENGRLSVCESRSVCT